MYSQKYLIRKSVITTLSAALFFGSTAFASGMALAATKPFPLPPMLHFTPIAPNTPVFQVAAMAKWNPEDMLDPDSKGGPAWGGLFDVEALGMSQDNPTSPQPSCPSGWSGSYTWPTKAQSIKWWESQPANKLLSNIQKYTYGTKQHFEWIVGTEYSHQDAMGWQDNCTPPPPPPSYSGGGGGGGGGGGLSLPGNAASFTTPWGSTINADGWVTGPGGQSVQGTVSGNNITFTGSNGITVTDSFTNGGYTSQQHGTGVVAAESNNGNVVSTSSDAYNSTNDGTIAVIHDTQNAQAAENAVNDVQNSGGSVAVTGTDGSSSNFSNNINSSFANSSSANW